jgi:hypothetical protein
VLHSAAGYIPAMMTTNLPRFERGHVHARAAALWLALSMLTAVLAPGIARAALGQDSTTVERDVAQLRAQRSIRTAGAYSVHQLQTPGGTQVREYLNASNQVFAVAWNGPSIPDLQQLLGGYFPRYRAAAQAIGRARRGVAVQDSDLVIRTGGHTRAFFGVAYLPAKMPAGVTEGDIR